MLLCYSDPVILFKMEKSRGKYFGSFSFRDAPSSVGQVLLSVGDNSETFCYRVLLFQGLAEDTESL